MKNDKRLQLEANLKAARAAYDAMLARIENCGRQAGITAMRHKLTVLQMDVLKAENAMRSELGA